MISIRPGRFLSHAPMATIPSQQCARIVAGRQLRQHHLLGLRQGLDGQARRHHVGVADGLDFLEAEAIGQFVEGGEDAVEELDQALDALAQLASHVRIPGEQLPGATGIALSVFFCLPLQQLTDQQAAQMSRQEG
mgnify:CR=1 FL=1